MNAEHKKDEEQRNENEAEFRDENKTNKTEKPQDNPRCKIKFNMPIKNKSTGTEIMSTTEYVNESDERKEKTTEEGINDNKRKHEIINKNLNTKEQRKDPKEPKWENPQEQNWTKEQILKSWTIWLYTIMSSWLSLT